MSRGIFERVPQSGIWWIRFADNAGRIRREKVGSKSAATKLYRRRKTEILEGKKFPENLRSVLRVERLKDALLNDYSDKKSLKQLESRLKRLMPFFGPMPANDLGTDDIDRYVKIRRDEGAQNGTINRELAALKRMFSLAYDSSPRRVRNLLRYPHLKEALPRQGFVEEAAYNALLQHADELWLRALLTTAHTFGFRSGELKDMRVGQIDATRGTIQLSVGTTKNDDGRTVVMTAAVRRLLLECIRGKGLDDYVFTRTADEPIKDFRGAWWSLCEKANLGKFVSVGKKQKWSGLLFHDLRRSAVRNMVRAGVPEVVAMKISGHNTRSIFDRYNIVSVSDLAEAAAKLEKSTSTTTSTKQISDRSRKVRFVA